ncbi:MAG: HupE/UreJ family protein [Acidimicrobiales bacterium]
MSQLSARRPSRADLAGMLAAGLLAPLLASAPAFAHIGHGTGGLGAGLAHPVTGPDHLLAMVAVGVVAVLGGSSRRAVLAPAAFLGGMLLGGIGGIAGVPLPGAEHLIVASVLVLGMVVAGAFEAPSGLLLGGLVLAGIAHGHAHGAEVPTSVHPAAYVAGFLAATAALHAAGIGVGTIIRDRRTLRIGMGTAMVAAGALLLV